MDGAEAFHLMKEIDPDCRIIIAKGFTDYESLSSIRKQGLAGFIHKPYGDNELSKLLKKVLEV